MHIWWNVQLCFLESRVWVDYGQNVPFISLLLMERWLTPKRRPFVTCARTRGGFLRLRPLYEVPPVVICAQSGCRICHLHPHQRGALRPLDEIISVLICARSSGPSRPLHDIRPVASATKATGGRTTGCRAGGKAGCKAGFGAFGKASPGAFVGSACPGSIMLVKATFKGLICVKVRLGNAFSQSKNRQKGGDIMEKWMESLEKGRYVQKVVGFFVRKDKKQ